MKMDPRCAACKPKYCTQGIKDESLLPAFCPLKNNKKTIQEVLKKYQNKQIHPFYLSSALTEKEAYKKRLEKKGELSLSGQELRKSQSLLKK